MKNIDTLDVQLCVKPSVKNLIKCKLHHDDTTRYGVGGIYFGHHIRKPYSFQYIPRGYYLIVTVEHKAMEGIETAKELQNKIIQMVVDYFHINQNDIVICGTKMLDNLVVRKKRILKNAVKKCKYIRLKMQDTRSNKKIKFRIQMQKRWKDEIRSYRTSRNKKIRICLGSISKKIDLVEINRIEYKNDYRLKVDDEKLAIIDIFRISPDKVKGANKSIYRYFDRTNCVYRSKNNNYVSITCYFKEYERLEDGDYDGATRYKNILRTEVKVKNKHLNYKKNVRNKTLTNYFKKEVAQEYFTKYVTPIFYTEDYYRLDVAVDIIKNYKPQQKGDIAVTNLEKNRVCTFITEINQLGISSVKDTLDDKTFKKYIGILKNLGINPLCFSPVIDGKEITIKKMKNFTLFENGISEDI